MPVTQPPSPSSLASPADDKMRRRRFWRTILMGWIGFWLLMLITGVQDYLRSGGRQLWEPLVDYSSSAVAASLVGWWQVVRGDKLQALLDRPSQWFGRMWAWLPLLVPLYVLISFGLRALIFTSVYGQYRPGAWSTILIYEGVKFTLFFVLFSAIHFGLLSYRAWFTEKLLAERQARLAQEARLAQLTQQLQPHFLFNALNTISALIHEQPQLADNLLHRLAALLRAASDASQQPIQTLGAELALLDAYTQIMMQRFGERVQFELKVAPQSYACLVPTLSLQPLLENCFVHVVEKRRSRTRISLTCAIQQEQLHIVLHDDGPDLALQSSHQGVALANLRERLEVLHGDKAHLALTRPEGGGTLATMQLPCVF